MRHYIGVYDDETNERRSRRREREAELKKEIGSILPSTSPSGMEGHSVREDVVIRRTLLESLAITFETRAKTRTERLATRVILAGNRVLYELVGGCLNAEQAPRIRSRTRNQGTIS